MAIRVYLSPSDQHGNIGSYPAGTSEKSWSRQIADQTSWHLRRVPGLEVRVGADRRPTIDEYAERVTESNAWGATLHVALHTNAGAGTDGTMVCCYPATDSRRLAAVLLGTVGRATAPADPGVRDRGDLWELSATKATAALIEYDRHDTPVGAARIMAGVKSGALALATAQGIVTYLGLKLPPLPAAPPPPPKATVTAPPPPKVPAPAPAPVAPPPPPVAPPVVAVDLSDVPGASMLAALVQAVPAMAADLAAIREDLAAVGVTVRALDGRL